MGERGSVVESQPGRRLLVRDSTTFEFVVRPPHGISAVVGYRKAARHFGLRTLVDPTTTGGDDTRILMHPSAAVLRKTAKALSRAMASENEGDAEDAEFWLARESGVHWFHHHWRHWDIDQDRGALENLGWRRRIVQSGDTYLVTLAVKRPHSRDPKRHR